MTIDEAENYLIALKHCETCEAQDTNICKACSDYRRGSSAKCYDAIDVGVDIMRKYQMMQADYENRLKADMVAMLEDLDLQIDELGAYNLEVAKVQRLIRDRINKLKGEEDGNE